MTNHAIGIHLNPGGGSSAARPSEAPRSDPKRRRHPTTPGAATAIRTRAAARPERLREGIGVARSTSAPSWPPVPAHARKGAVRCADLRASTVCSLTSARWPPPATSPAATVKHALA